MKFLGRLLLFAITLPWSLTVGYGWVFLFCLIGAAHELRWEPTAVLTAIWRPWAAKRWRYSTTLGRGIIYHADRRAPRGEPWTTIQDHEHVHIRQVEDLMLLSLCVGSTVYAASGKWWLGLLCWWSGGAWQIPGFATAFLRGGNPYRDAEHERHARSWVLYRGEKHDS